MNMRNVWFRLRASLKTGILMAACFVLTNGPSLADWRKDVGVFRVGVVGAGDRSLIQVRMEPFRLALSESLDMDVEFFVSRTPDGLIDALASERIEYAVLSATGYALAWNACECVEPLAVPKSPDSTDGYHVILVSGPGGPKSLEQLPQTPIGALAKSSLTGSELAKYLLGKQGIVIDGPDNPLGFAESAGTMLQEFGSGKYQAMIGWSSLTGNPSDGYSRGSLRQLARLKNVNILDYKVLWRSKQVPHPPHVVQKKLDGEAKQILRITLENLSEKDPVAYDSIEPVYGGGFAGISHQRFSELVELVNSLDPESKAAKDEPSPQ